MQPQYPDFNITHLTDLRIQANEYRTQPESTQNLLTRVPPHNVYSSDENVLVGVNLQTHVVCIKGLLCKLLSGLSEVRQNAGILDQLQPEDHATDNFLEKSLL